MKRKILIVEDDLVHRDHLARLITRLGHDPVCLSSGQEALDMIMKRRDPSIAAILLDLVMPDLDGMGVITRLRMAGYRTPIIVLVKPTALDSALSAVAAGAQDFCLVPAGFERIAVSLKNIMAPSVVTLKESVRSETGFLSASSPVTARGSWTAFGEEARAQSSSAHTVALLDHKGGLRSLASIERHVIAFAIKNNSEPLSTIARALGISRSTLYRRIEELAHSELENNSPIYGDAA